MKTDQALLSFERLKVKKIKYLKTVVATSSNLVQVYGIHKLMLMRPEREYLKDRHTYFHIVSLYFRDW